ncbi:MAG: dienelactone hydrolase family protein [Chitinophagales bacterium]|nr:dienelactone hydrolase family protein [Chitinophagales bacterium]HMV15459.1 dienelactone hydrolase family protein [Chitinophagales bacterium]HMW13172.1 dienelactone hydrolase family protein [Chitinophagales bacterium]HMX59640.1 dienelactone hydrolase family protein [Chitinophagales bacterium]HMY22262.1 dienelactone hydrolase family protein [Chitinophagales bacterium]
MQKIQLSLQKRTIDAYFFEASSNQIRPAIIFLPDLSGIQKTTIKSAEILCSDGDYHVIIPDLYSGGSSLRKYCMQFLMSSIARNNEANNNAPLDEFFEIIEAVKSLDLIDENNLGVVGQCLTGGFVLHAALRPEVKAPVVFHHSLGMKGSGMPKSCSSLIDKKVQGHFAYVDAFCPVWKVRQLETELNGNLETHWYNLPHGIPHLFFNTAQGQKAFESMSAFFQEQLQ